MNITEGREGAPDYALDVANTFADRLAEVKKEDIEDGDPSFVSATNAVVTVGVATAEEIAAFIKQAIDN